MKMVENKSKSAEASEKMVVNLPEDVLVEILTRLPVKSLLRLSCACKSWYRLTVDPTFIRKHFIQYTFNLEISRDLLVVGIGENGYIGDCFSQISFSTDKPSQLPTKLDTTVLMNLREIQSNHKFYSYFCYGFGIVCFRNSSDDRLALWNPATKEFRVLPKLPQPICLDPDTRFYHPTFPFGGIGIDSSTTDYKLVHFGNRGTIGSDIEVELVSLYTFNTNSWKTLLNVQCNTQLSLGYQVAASINGSPWWLAIDTNNIGNPMDSGYDFVVCFDMKVEVFRYYRLPQSCHGLYTGDYSLIQVHTYVALGICHQVSHVDFTFDIWVMKDGFANEVKWNKIFSVGPFPWVDKVIGFWPNSNSSIIVLQERGSKQLMFYDIHAHKTQNFELNVPQGFHHSEVHVFSDSLVHVGGIIDFFTFSFDVEEVEF